MIEPADTPCAPATSFAAINTESSISKVVRIKASLHQIRRFQEPRPVQGLGTK
jgi:hypothetical protein